MGVELDRYSEVRAPATVEDVEYWVRMANENLAIYLSNDSKYDHWDKEAVLRAAYNGATMAKRRLEEILGAL